MTKCTKIVFSNRACNAMVSETLDKSSTETGGILLGKIIGSKWYVIESIDPGPNSIFTVVYFEYDTAYVNHLAKVVSRLYNVELEVLGLWHRHPGSMDTFSSTDNHTNSEFAKINAKGAISGLVNIDPTMRLTIYHVSFPLKYEKVDFAVGDHLFPEDLFKYKHAEENKTINFHQHCLPFVSRNTLPSFHKQNTLFDKFYSYISCMRSSFLTASQLTTNMNVFIGFLKTSFGANEEVDEQSLERVLREEILLDERGYQYQCEARGSRLVYHITGNKEIECFIPGIKFSVNVNTPNPICNFTQKKVHLTEGAFLKYVESCLNKTKFIS